MEENITTQKLRTSRRQYDKANIPLALKDITEGMSIRAAGKKYKIPEATLRHKLSGFRGMDSKPGPKKPKPLLPADVEERVAVNVEVDVEVTPIKNIPESDGPKTTTRGKYDKANIPAAMKDVTNGMSIRAAGKKYKIPEATLRHKMTGYRSIGSKPGPKPLLTEAEEMSLVSYIKNAHDSGNPMTKSKVLNAVGQFLQEAEYESGEVRSKPPGFSGYQPKQKWWKLFKKRHPDLVKLIFFNTQKKKKQTLPMAMVEGEYQSGWRPEGVYHGGWRPEGGLKAEGECHGEEWKVELREVREDHGGSREIACQAQPDNISRASQTTSSTFEPRPDISSKGSLCDLVLDYKGYAPFLKQYRDVPFTGFSLQDGSDDDSDDDDDGNDNKAYNTMMVDEGSSAVQYPLEEPLIDSWVGVRVNRASASDNFHPLTPFDVYIARVRAMNDGVLSVVFLREMSAGFYVNPEVEQCAYPILREEVVVLKPPSVDYKDSIFGFTFPANVKITLMSFFSTLK